MSTFQHRFNARRQKALGMLAAAGLPPRQAAPWPLFQLWRLNIPVRPPLFAPYWLNVAWISAPTALLWMCGSYVGWLWRLPKGAWWFSLVGGAMAGLAFGLTRAAILNHQRKALALPAWESLDTADGPPPGAGP